MGEIPRFAQNDKDFGVLVGGGYVLAPEPPKHLHHQPINVVTNCHSERNAMELQNLFNNSIFNGPGPRPVHCFEKEKNNYHRWRNPEISGCNLCLAQQGKNKVSHPQNSIRPAPATKKIHSNLQKLPD